MELAALDRALQALFVQGLSLSSYRSGIRRYVAFCLHLHLHPLPLSDLTLCRFVSSLYTQRLSHSSIRSYVSSLRFLQILAGGPDPGLGAFLQLYYEVAVCPLSPIALLGSQSLRTF